MGGQTRGTINTREQIALLWESGTITRHDMFSTDGQEGFYRAIIEIEADLPDRAATLAPTAPPQINSNHAFLALKA